MKDLNDASDIETGIHLWTLFVALSSFRSYLYHEDLNEPLPAVNPVWGKSSLSRSGEA